VSLNKTVAINNSVTKQRFSFSKDSRWKDPKVHTTIHTYDSSGEKGVIKNSPNTSNGLSFGKQDRFQYKFIDPKERDVPSPNAYLVPRN
jgi:hypothetical protein